MAKPKSGLCWKIEEGEGGLSKIISKPEAANERKVEGEGFGHCKENEIRIMTGNKMTKVPFGWDVGNTPAISKEDFNH